MKKTQSIIKSIDHTYSDLLIKNGAIAYASLKSGSPVFGATLSFVVAILAIPKASQLLFAYLYQKGSSLLRNTSKLKSRNIIATNIGSTTVSTSNALEARLKVSPNMLAGLGKNKQIQSLLKAKAEKKLGKSNVAQLTRSVSDITELAGSNDTYQAFLESSISATKELNRVITKVPGKGASDNNESNTDTASPHPML